MKKELEKFKSKISKFKVEKDEVIVVKLNKEMSCHEREIAKQLMAMFKDNRIMVLNNDNTDLAIGKLLTAGEEKIKITREV